MMETGVLEHEIRETMSQDPDNPLLNYLLGLILIDQYHTPPCHTSHHRCAVRHQMEEAQTMLSRSIRSFPCHWGAWQVVVCYVGVRIERVTCRH